MKNGFSDVEKQLCLIDKYYERKITAFMQKVVQR